MKKTKKIHQLLSKVLSGFTIFNLIFAQLLLVGLFAFPGTALAATVNLAPNGIGSYDKWSVNTGTKVTAVATNDGDTSYISETENNEAQTFTVPGAVVPVGSTINSVTLNVVAKESGGNTSIALRMEKGTGPGNQSDGSSHNLSNSYSPYSRTMTTNPLTSPPAAWTVAEVNNWTTRFGVVKKDSSHTARVTQISIVVDYTPDTTPPTVTINQAAEQIDPAYSSPINFTVTFSESVPDFATGDVTLGGTAGATTATVTGSGTTYNVAVSGMTSDGTVTASIGADVAHDAAGNGNTTSTSSDNTVTFNYGWYVPNNTTNAPGKTAFISATNGYSSDNQYAEARSDNYVQRYYNFNIPTIPTGSIINGIEVEMEAYRDSMSNIRKFDVSLSWNGGSSMTSVINSGDFGTSDTIRIVGGATNTWGRTWSPDDFTNDNFRVQLDTTTGSSNKYLYLDQMQVKVFYTVAVCGDGLITGSEACDDGNTISEDGCSATCTLESGWTCSGKPSACTTICGDGIIIGSEVCDSNSQSCLYSASDGYLGIQNCNAQCSGFDVCEQTEYCGDGILNGLESCEIGDSQACTTQDGYAGTQNCLDCFNYGECVSDQYCGDWQINGNEVCDDGASNGQPNYCNYDCTGTTTPVCGNGIIESEEQCEAISAGEWDSCCDSSTCQFKSSDSVCRESVGECDVVDYCTGQSATCSSDDKSIAECRPTNGQCDIAEFCDGVNNDCPADVKAPQYTLCNDNLFCTVNDVCDGQGTCSGSTKDCSDEIECTDDSCDEDADECVNVPNDANCSADEWVDTGNTQWVSTGSCTEKEQKEQEYRDCYCDADSDCQYTVTNSRWVDTGETRDKQDRTSCSDGNACTENDVCSQGVCSGTPINCDDGIDCTLDTCVNGNCQHDTSACACTEDANCDDSNPCTDNTCNLETYSCELAYNTNQCNDNNFCTEGDICSQGVCSGTPINCDDDNVCTDDSCNPETGCVCAPNTAQCDDGNSCTIDDICSEGICSGTPINCDDGIDCTLDTCVGGVCQHNDSACSSISGYKWNDINGDGKWDEGEPVVDHTDVPPYGVTVYLDLNQNGEQDEGEPRIDTDNNGYYFFSDLVPGEYSVCERDDIIPGWVRTFPVESHCQSVIVNSGQETGRVNFGNFKLAEISGYKWHDLNNNGQWDEDEPFLSDWEIKATKGDIIKTALTDLLGFYGFIFNPLELGNWIISEILQPNHKQTLPTDNNGTYIINISGSGQNESRDFGNIRYYEKLGAKFAPLNGKFDSTTSLLVLEDSSIDVTTGDGTSTISLPEGTIITREGGGNIDGGLLTADAVTTGSLTGLGTGVVVEGALKWGLEALGLEFSQPITVSIFVGTAFNGQTLNILRSVSGTSDWTNDGIVPPATCVVTNGLCTFQATKASFYAAIRSIVAVVTGGGGGGGGFSSPPGLSIQDETVKVVATDKTSITITWTTNYPSTSQIIYAKEGEKHTLDLTDNTGTPPKYGYAQTTPEYNLDPKVINHTVVITGLTPSAKYYYRIVSRGSLIVGPEYTFFTALGIILGEQIPGQEQLPTTFPPEGTIPTLFTPPTGPGVIPPVSPTPEITPTPLTEEITPATEEITPETVSPETGVPGAPATAAGSLAATGSLAMLWQGITSSFFRTLLTILSLIILIFFIFKEIKRPKKNKDQQK